MKKGKDQDKKVFKKVGRGIKDIIPFSNKTPREMLPFPIPENVKKEFFSEYETFEILPEWPGNEIANVIYFVIN